MTLFLTAFVDNKSFESQHTSKKVFQGGHVDAIDLISNGRLAGSGDGALAPSKLETSSVQTPTPAGLCAPISPDTHQRYYTTSENCVTVEV